MQRAVYQPVLLVILAISAGSLAFAGSLSGETLKLYLFGLPALVAGAWVGFRLYGRLDEAAFHKMILILLLVSGLTLVVPPMY